MLEYQKSSAALGLATQLEVRVKCLTTNPILTQRAQQDKTSKKTYTSQNTRDLVSLTSHLTIQDGDTFNFFIFKPIFLLP